MIVHDRPGLLFDVYFTKNYHGRMSKSLIDAPLTTREARKRLADGLYWRSLDPDVHLGYRKSKRAGVWLVRWRTADGYKRKQIGTADDQISVGTLDFAKATTAARKEVELVRIEAVAEEAGPAATVRSAVEAYIAFRNARETRRAGRPTRSDAARRLERYVIGREAIRQRPAAAPAPLAKIALHTLTEKDLSNWRKGLPDEFKRSGSQRLINDLRAALNAAYDEHKARLPATLPGIIKSAFKAQQHDDDDGEAVSRDGQILSDAQVSAILVAAGEIDVEHGWEGDFYRLLLLLAATGARFSQIVRMKVRDVQYDRNRLMVPLSRKGKGRKVGWATVPVGQDVLEALASVTEGRKLDDVLLQRWRYEQQAGAIRWVPIERVPWQTPSEIVRAWHEIRDRLGLTDVVPYALRHSSIVRGIRANLPLRLVAAIHDTSVTMIERHYARYITDGLEDLAARAIVPLVA